MKELHISLPFNLKAILPICQRVPSNVTRGDSTNIFKTHSVSQVFSGVSEYADSIATLLSRSQSAMTMECKSDTIDMKDYIEIIYNGIHIGYAPFNRGLIQEITTNVPEHSVELEFYIIRYLKIKNFYKELNKSTHLRFVTRKIAKKKPHVLSDSTATVSNNFREYDMELIWLRKCIETYLPNMRKLYHQYSRIMKHGIVDEKQETEYLFDDSMNKLMFWQLLRDYGMHKQFDSVATIDSLLDNNPYVYLGEHVFNPFETIQFWKFIHCLLELSWQLFSGQEQTHRTTWPTHLSGCLYRLVSETLKKQNEEGEALRSDMYKYHISDLYERFKEIGNPLSVRNFAKYIIENKLLPHDDRESEKDSFYVCWEIFQQDKTPMGEKPLEDIEDNLATSKNHLKLNTSIIKLELNDIIAAVSHVCPNIRHHTTIVNIDIEINFLEFFEILVVLFESNTQRVRNFIISEAVKDFYTKNILPMKKEKASKATGTPKKGKK